ncbi:MAG: hypothetical protein OEZ43_05615 [Gammaproteobacteria bacterium]|nr:hypothetical protein [Gammaproteobacteria bacterium]
MKKHLIWVILLACVSTLTNPVFAAESTEKADLANEESWSHFENLIDTIKYTRKQLANKRSALRKAVTEREKERLTQEVEQISQDVQSLQIALEMLLTGGADMSLFGVQEEEKKFDWREQLESVFEPIVVEMRKLTERPRKIERLKRELEIYQERLDVAEAAVLSVSVHRENAPTPQLKTAFKGIEERWVHRRNDLKNRMSVAQFELKQLQKPAGATQRDPATALKELLGTRVLNLFLALVVMAVVYGVLKYLANLYHQAVMRRAHTRKVFAARFVNLLFYSLTGLVVLLSGMAVFYVRGDWILLTILLIVVAGAAWALQKYLPKVLTEMKIMLNFGPVREGERINYNGLPWQVNALTFYATLVNPALQGGSLQVPVRELVSYQSRKFEAGEPWFPSQVGDYILFDDEVFGEVITQTPEMVQVKVYDSIQTFSTSAYIDKQPRNLSKNGFTYMIPFGLDYRHQSEITGKIVDLLGASLKRGLEAEDAGKFLQDLHVTFDQAGASSLDMIIVARFSGKAASDYLVNRRLIQKLSVEACNHYGWVIPFNQLTVHSVVS